MSESMYESFAVEDNARRGHRQPVPPLSREDRRAAVKRLRQPNAGRNVMTKSTECHDGQTLLSGPAGRSRLRKDENPDRDRTAALNRVGTTSSNWSRVATLAGSSGPSRSTRPRSTTPPMRSAPAERMSSSSSGSITSPTPSTPATPIEPTRRSALELVHEVRSQPAGK